MGLNKITEIVCDSCEKKMHFVTETFAIFLSGDKQIHSDPVSFFRCECGEVEFLPKEMVRAEQSAVKNYLFEALKNKEHLRGRYLKDIRSILGLKAKQLSLDLGYQSSTVTQWEARDIEFDKISSEGLALFLLRAMIFSGVAGAEEVHKGLSFQWTK